MDDNLSNSTFVVMMNEFLDRLSEKIRSTNTSNTTDNSEILNQIKNILDDIKTQNGSKSDTTYHTSPENRDIGDKVAQAIKETYDVGESSVLSEMESQKTLLQEIAEQEETQKKLQSDVKDGIKEATHHIKNIASKVSTQMSTGKLELGPFSGFVSIMQNSETLYRNAVAMGQDFGGSILTMRNTMSQSGMTLDQFNKALTSGSQGLRMMGMNAFSGFAGAVNKSVKALGDLGMTGDQLSEAMSTYSDGLRTSGRLGMMNQQQMTTGFRDFALAATQLSHDVGISRQEAMERLNRAKSMPDINLLLRGIGERGRQTTDQIMAGFENSPLLKSIFQSQVYTAQLGAAPTAEVAKLLSAAGPNAYQIYSQGAAIERRIQRSSTSEEANRLRQEYYQVMSKLTANVDQRQAYFGLQGNAYGQMATNLYGETQAFNFNQVARNTGETPKTQAEIGGTDSITRAVLQTNHTMQEFVNHYDMLKTQIISSNQELITNVIKTYNSLEQFLTGKIDYLTGLIKGSYGASSGIGSAIGTLANHPGATLLGMGALAVMGHGAVGGLVRSGIKAGSAAIHIIRGTTPAKAASAAENIVKDTKAASTVSKVVESSGIMNGIKSLFGRAAPIASETSTLGRVASVAKMIPGVSLLSRASPWIGAGLLASDLYGDYNKITSQNTGKTKQEQAEQSQSKWGAYASLGMTGLGAIGGGLLGSFLMPGVGTVGGALAGADLMHSVGDIFGNNLYKTLHPESWYRTNPNVPTHLYPQNNQNTEQPQDQSLDQDQPDFYNQPFNQIPQVKNPVDDILKKMSDNSDASNVLLRQMLTRLEDLNRNIRNNSGIVN